MWMQVACSQICNALSRSAVLACGRQLPLPRCLVRIIPAAVPEHWGRIAVWSAPHQPRRFTVTSAPGRFPENDPAPSEPAAAWPAGLQATALAALPDFLLKQRWYPAKDAGRPMVTLSSLLPFLVPGVTAAIAAWQVTPPGQAPLLLFVPLALVPAAAAGSA